MAGLEVRWLADRRTDEETEEGFYDENEEASEKENGKGSE